MFKQQAKTWEENIKYGLCPIKCMPKTFSGVYSNSVEANTQRNKSSHLMPEHSQLITYVSTQHFQKTTTETSTQI